MRRLLDEIKHILADNRSRHGCHGDYSIGFSEQMQHSVNCSNSRRCDSCIARRQHGCKTHNVEQSLECNDNNRIDRRKLRQDDTTNNERSRIYYDRFYGPNIDKGNSHWQQSNCDSSNNFNDRSFRNGRDMNSSS